MTPWWASADSNCRAASDRGSPSPARSSRTAPVLVLDEATSHLDAVSEGMVHRALGRLMEGRSSLVIAHRLSTVRDADIIVVLDEGSVVEQGALDELLASGGAYSQLVTAQVTSQRGGRSEA